MPMAPVSWEKGFTRTLTEGNTVKILIINDILLPSNQNFNEVTRTGYCGLSKLSWIKNGLMRSEEVFGRSELPGT